MNTKPTFVTKSFLPDLEGYFHYVKRAFENEILTNRGELVKELEQKLTSYLTLDSSQIIVTNNGTIPLQIALKLLGNQGEIITTPFSYVATTSSIIWESCVPIFVDIHPEFLTIDENQIEAAISKKTTCILATHVFGNPCNVEKIEQIAKKYNIKVIYDGAHCFGVKYKGKSIFEYGDLSTCSFHATKLFHTAEGGAIFCSDATLFNQTFYSHNFGHDGPTNFHGLGINGKISELQAAMGLSILPYIDQIMLNRKLIVNKYNAELDSLKFNKMILRDDTDWNYSYYPIILPDEGSLIFIQEKLSKHNIFPRRYFYPSLNTLPYVNYQQMPISEDISKRILCLPLYYNLEEEILNKIIFILNTEVH